MKHSNLIPSSWKELAKRTKWPASKWHTRFIGHIQFGISRWEVDITLSGADGCYHGSCYDTARDACDGLERLIDEVAECLSLISE